MVFFYVNQQGLILGKTLVDPFGTHPRKVAAQSGESSPGHRT